MINIALAAGNTDHLALYLPFEFCWIDIKSRTFVKTWEQQFSLFSNLEGNGSLFGLNPDELFFLVDSNDETYVVVMVFLILMGFGARLTGNWC